MHKSKLFILLKTLSKEEFQRFRKVLQSPFFINNPHPLQLYDSLKRFYPAFESAQLSKKRIFEKVYPNEIYDDSKMRTLMKRCTQLLEEFLIWLEIKEGKRQQEKWRMKVYAKRDLFDWYERDRKNYIKALENEPYRDLEFYQDFVEIDEEYFYHPARQKLDPKDTTLETLMANIDKRFILTKMRFGIEMRNLERILQKEYDFRFWEAIEQELPKHQDNIVIQLFSLLFKLFSEEREELFEELEGLFFPNIEQLRTLDAQLVYYYGLNYINRKVNQGKSKFSPRAFEWYKFGLKDDLLIFNGKISEVSFGNLVIYGCREKEFDWTKNFIDEFGIKLNAKQTKDVRQYNLGLWHYYKGALHEAFSILNQFSFHESYQLKVRFTSLRILFEQYLEDNSFYDSVILHSKAILKFMQRTNFHSKTIIEPHKNTVELVKTICTKLWNGEKKIDIQKWYKRKLSLNQKMVLKNWLTEKVENL